MSAEADELRAHATELIARLIGDRRAVEVGDGPPPSDAEALMLTREVADRERLRARLATIRDAAGAGKPVAVYVPNRDATTLGSGSTPAELRDLFAETASVALLEQRRVEAAIADLGSSGGWALAPEDRVPAERLLALANLPAPAESEARLVTNPPSRGRRVELQRRLFELRERNLDLARSRLGAPLEDRAASRARVAERRLLFARVREIVSALLSRRRLRG